MKIGSKLVLAAFIAFGALEAVHAETAGDWPRYGHDGA